MFLFVQVIEVELFGKFYIVIGFLFYRILFLLSLVMRILIFVEISFLRVFCYQVLVFRELCGANLRFKCVVVEVTQRVRKVLWSDL